MRGHLFLALISAGWFSITVHSAKIMERIYIIQQLIR